MTVPAAALPNTSAQARPATSAPAGACDAHMHILDPRFAPIAAVLPGATVAEYRQIQALNGTTRTVVVQPRPFGTDNRVTLDAIRELGIDRTRGVAVVNPDITDAELQALHAGGIRGIRFSLHTAVHAAVGFEMVEPLAQRVHAWGWHLQLHWSADQLLAHGSMLQRLPTPLVFDHLGRLPLPMGTAHPAFALIRGLLDQGRAWVKLSGAYLDTRQPHGQGYADTDAVARAWVRAAPERLVWGSDWPHTTETERKPDDAELFDLLARWSGDEKVRQRVLVDNPAALYGFGSA
ncbi:MAG: amidohydrolase family protein [Comamonas sp.]